MEFLSLEPWKYLPVGSTYRALNTQRAMHFQNVGLFLLLSSFLLLSAFAPELLPATFVLANNLTLSIYATYLVLTYAAASFYLKSNPFPYLLTFVSGLASELLLFVAKIVGTVLGFLADIVDDLCCQPPDDLSSPDEYRSTVKLLKMPVSDGAGLMSAPPPPVSRDTAREVVVAEAEEEEAAAEEEAHEEIVVAPVASRLT